MIPVNVNARTLGRLATAVVTAVFIPLVLLMPLVPTSVSAHMLGCMPSAANATTLNPITAILPTLRFNGTEHHA